MDFLGLRNLDVIEISLDLIEQTTGLASRHRRVPLDDEPTFELLRAGDSIGVFQLEGAAMRAPLRSLAPTSFDDVAALVALYRPGPMAANMHSDYADRKNGRKPVAYPHPDLEAILGDTYGLMIYQESVMRVAQKFAGYSLEEADNLRKACGKKIRELIAGAHEVRRRLRRAGLRRGARQEALRHHRAVRRLRLQQVALVRLRLRRLPDRVAEGELSRSSTWPRCSSSVKDNKDKTAVYLNECRTLGIQVLVPDVNESVPDFTTIRATSQGQALRAATSSSSASRRSATWGRARRAHRRRARGRRPVHRLLRLLRRVDPSALNKRTVESLVKAGAFDSLGHPAQGALPGFRGDRRPHARAPPRARAGDHDPVRAPRRRSRGRRPDGASPASFDGTGWRSPTPSSTSPSAWRSRRRCSAST